MQTSTVCSLGFAGLIFPVWLISSPGLFIPFPPYQQLPLDNGTQIRHVWTTWECARRANYCAVFFRPRSNMSVDGRQTSLVTGDGRISMMKHLFPVRREDKHVAQTKGTTLWAAFGQAVPSLLKHSRQHRAFKNMVNEVCLQTSESLNT